MDKRLQPYRTELDRIAQALKQTEAQLKAQHAQHQTLRQDYAALLHERDTLREQNEQSRLRIDAMVARLKGFE